MKNLEFPAELRGEIDDRLYRRLTQIYQMLYDLDQRQQTIPAVTKQLVRSQLQLLGVLREPLLGQENVDPQLTAAATVPGTLTDLTGVGGTNITVTVNTTGPGNSGRQIVIDISDDPTFNSVDVATVYKVGGVAVVGAQGAAIPDPVGGVTIDAEARAAVIDILNFLQGWGAIA